MKQLAISLVAFLMIVGPTYSQRLQFGKEQKVEQTEYLTFTLSDKVAKQNVK